MTTTKTATLRAETMNDDDEEYDGMRCLACDCVISEHDEPDGLYAAYADGTQHFVCPDDYDFDRSRIVGIPRGYTHLGHGECGAIVTLEEGWRA